MILVIQAIQPNQNREELYREGTFKRVFKFPKWPNMRASTVLIFCNSQVVIFFFKRFDSL